MDPCSHRFAVLILAAGASRRMGTPKALLSWRGSTVLAHLLDLWTRAGAAQIGVAHDPLNLAVGEELERTGVKDRILNHHAAEGMMSSLRAASSWDGWQQDLQQVIVVLVDQPQLPLDAAIQLAKLAECHPSDVCQPQCEDLRGHPVVLPWAVFAALAETTEGALRDFIRARKLSRHFLSVPERWMLEDMDTPADFQRITAFDDARRDG